MCCAYAGQSFVFSCVSCPKVGRTSSRKGSTRRFMAAISFSDCCSSSLLYLRVSEATWLCYRAESSSTSSAKPERVFACRFAFAGVPRSVDPIEHSFSSARLSTRWQGIPPSSQVRRISESSLRTQIGVPAVRAGCAQRMTEETSCNRRSCAAISTGCLRFS